QIEIEMHLLDGRHELRRDVRADGVVNELVAVGILRGVQGLDVSSETGVSPDRQKNGMQVREKTARERAKSTVKRRAGTNESRWKRGERDKTNREERSIVETEDEEKKIGREGTDPMTLAY